MADELEDTAGEEVEPAVRELDGSEPAEMEEIGIESLPANPDAVFSFSDDEAEEVEAEFDPEPPRSIAEPEPEPAPEPARPQALTAAQIAPVPDMKSVEAVYKAAPEGAIMTVRTKAEFMLVQKLDLQEQKLYGIKIAEIEGRPPRWQVPKNRPR